MLLLAYSVPSFCEGYTFIFIPDKYLLSIHLIMRLHSPQVILLPLPTFVVNTSRPRARAFSYARSIISLLAERYFKYRTWLLDIQDMFVASYGHPSHHGVMNASVILTRGTHSGGQVDMHIKMHTSIRTNIFTIITLFMGMENVFVHMPYVRFDREA